MHIKKLTFIGNNMFRIDIDDVVLKIDDESTYKYKLRPGMQIDADMFEVLVKKADFISAKEYLTACLSRSSNCRKMLDRKLMQKGFGPQTRNEALDFFAKNGLIDDSLYAQNYVRSAVNTKHFGKSRIRMELMKKGIDREIIDNVLDQISDNDVLREAVQKELSKISNPDSKAVEKIRRRLYSRGFNIWDINNCLDSIGGTDEQ